uniref:Ribosome biogenesis protein SLX9, homolog of Volvox carteri MT0044 n=1 Tax=Yamagishiella unicocca TaxID=51707 RepID=A0A2Z5X8B6_9CHLO|nr:ribosome biogenesis protein SLX9, homolog of Volvox carteri MT0044 [Yamagishiella unicocca]
MAWRRCQVKKKVGGGKRFKALVNAKAQELSEPKWDGPAPPLHIQKKLTRKVQFLDKVTTHASNLLATKSGGVSKKSARKVLPDLSTLGAILEEVSKRGLCAGGQKGDSQKKQRGTAVNSAKQRQHILLEESQRLQQVLQHPLYKKDPIAAITNHLQHTLPPVPPPKPIRNKDTGKKKSKDNKRNKIAAGGAVNEA